MTVWQPKLDWLLAMIGFIISVLNASMTCCTCGHLDYYSLPGNMLGFGITWCAFLFGKDKRNSIRVFIMIMCILVALIVAGNIGDILWFGHDPVFELK